MSLDINKPRVFLSHSTIDKPFIERLDKDLRCSLIDTWIDTIEIRHGVPWLDSIFQGGIPQCDSTLVYFTPNSIVSEVVKKEVDASIMRRLQDSDVGFIPLISDSGLRSELRSDLVALQIPEFNNLNYCEHFPRIVADIWKNYHLRTMKQAISLERVARLEAEKQIDMMKAEREERVFSEAEEIEFEYAFARMSRTGRFQVEVYHNRDSPVLANTQELYFELDILSLVRCIGKSNMPEYDVEMCNRAMRSAVAKVEGKMRVLDSLWYCKVNSGRIGYLLADMLLTFGMLERLVLQSQYALDDGGINSRLDHSLVFTSKFHRFNYWLEFRKQIDSELKIQAFDPNEVAS